MDTLTSVLSLTSAVQWARISSSSARSAAQMQAPGLRGGAIEYCDLHAIQAHRDVSRRTTKIICTVGPSSWDVETLGRLVDAGMNVMRLNFSHGDHETHGRTMDRLREAMATRRHTMVATMLDTKGPEVRTGKLEGGGPVCYQKGTEVEITTDYETLGNPHLIACSYKKLPQTVSPGMKILVADGALGLTVLECREHSVIARVDNNALIGERKNMNLPGAIVDLPVLTEKDVDDIVNFGIVQGVDFIAASFVRKGADIDHIREVLGDAGAYIKIIAKIENEEGLQNYDEILAKADAIMVARGDLGMEIPPEKVFLAQKMMIRKANLVGKPVITATQMLESMIKNPRPTRAECADVANAVLDGTDCVMLSGETANGDFPVEAVEIMARVCCEAEAIMNYDAMYQAIRTSVLNEIGYMAASESVASSAVKTAWDMDAKMIVVLTETGTTARLIAKYRPQMPILVITAVHEVGRQCQGYLKNTHCRVLESMIGTESILFRAVDMGRKYGWIKPGDSVVCVHGMVEATPGSTNIMRVLTV